MSLIKCPECGKVFSDRAAHCPQCGLPTSEALQAIVNPAPQQSGESTPHDESQTTTTGQPQVQPSVTPTPVTDFRPQSQRRPNNALLYVLICVVILLAITCIALIMHEKFGGSDEGALPSDSLEVAVDELAPDTIPTPVIEPKPVQVTPVEDLDVVEETEVTPEKLPEIAEPTDPTAPAQPQAQPQQPAQPQPTPAPAPAQHPTPQPTPTQPSTAY